MKPKKIEEMPITAIELSSPSKEGRYILSILNCVIKAFDLDIEIIGPKRIEEMPKRYMDSTILEQ